MNSGVYLDCTKWKYQLPDDIELLMRVYAPFDQCIQRMHLCWTLSVTFLLIQQSNLATEAGNARDQLTYCIIFFLIFSVQSIFPFHNSMLMAFQPQLTLSSSGSAQELFIDLKSKP